MQLLALCPNCSAATTLEAFGVVAPWIIELCLKDSPGETEMGSCTDCGLHFFSYRDSDSDLASIYGKYRDSTFFSVRRKREPWYNEAVNDAFSDPINNPHQVTICRDFTENSLRAACLQQGDLNGCINFGGDHGQFIPQEVKPPCIVVEQNSKGKRLNNDFVFVDSIDEVNQTDDLVMNNYVLEHLNDLGGVVQSMKQKCSNDGVLHFEVPLDKFYCSRFHRTQFYKCYIEALTQIRLAFIFIDFLSGAYRQFCGRIPWFGIVKQSEHINYFDVRSLQAFLSAQGERVICLSEPATTYKIGRIKQGRLSCVTK
jgi:hypothetical protein